MRLLPLVPPSWREQPWWPPVVRGVVLAVLIPSLVLGTWYRIQAYLVAQEQPLDPDQVGYHQLAREMGHPYQSGYREPLQIVLVKVALVLLGDRPSSVLIPTLAASVVLIVVTFLFGRAVFGLAVGLAGSALVAYNHFLISSGAKGYRMELFGVLVLVYVYVLFVAGGWRPWRRLLLAGVVGGLLLLLRITTLSLLVPALALWVWREWRRVGGGRRLVVCAALSLAIGLAMLAPYLVECWRESGRPLWAIDCHAQFWTEAEAGLHLEGFPHEHVSISVFAYLFAEGRWARSLWRFVQGYWVAVRMLPWYGGSWRFALPFALAGAVMTVVRRERYLLWVAFWTYLPFSVVMPVGASPRFFMCLYPLYALWIVVGLYPLGFGVLYYFTRGNAARWGAPIQGGSTAAPPNRQSGA